MSALDQVVKINISQNSAPIQQASFSIPLIMGPTVPTTGIVSAYTSPAAMLTNGYTTSSPEYIYALEMFEQALTPTEFLVGKRTTAVDQVSTATPDISSQAIQHYIETIAGVPYDFTSDASPTAAEVVTGLIALINADSNCPALASGTNTLILTAKVAGAGFTASGSTNLPTVVTTASNGIQNDIIAVSAINNLWYGLCITEGTDADVLQASALIESLKKIYIAISDSSAIPTSSSTDVASVLKSKDYSRTGLIYTVPANVNEGKEAAWLGGQLPAVPGSNNWAYKTLVGCTPDVLSDNAQAILIGDPVAGIQGKNVNIYQTLGGANVTQMGTMAGGQFIDITVGIDWLDATLQSNVFQALTSSAKIPYTDKGTGILISAVKAAIDLGVANGLIDGDSPILISAPPVLSVPTSQRANRIAPTISFSCRLAGAFNAVIVNGQVTV